MSAPLACGRRLGSQAPQRHPTFGLGPILSVCLCSLAFAAGQGHAGLAVSDVVVVVNGASLNSRTLANHYVAFRGIPARNVIVLDQVPNSELISVSDFREKILRPLLSEVERRKLASHVQCIAYSADFPTAIDISADLASLGELPVIFTSQGSINGLTFLYAQVLSGTPLYIGATQADLTSNFYARRANEVYFTNPSGDLTREKWDAIQALIADADHRAASESLLELFKQQPHQFPLAYLAAAEAARSEEPTSGIALLKTAFDAGWTDGAYLSDDLRFDSLRKNSEFQVLQYLFDDEDTGFQRRHGFDASKAWTPNGIPVADPQLGYRYLLSTVLGVTRGGGTTLGRAIESLRRAAAADSTHPQGTFYFSDTTDVRSQTRKPGFEEAARQLREMGFGAEIITSVFPQGRNDVLGVQIGTPTFDWGPSQSRLMPGAIAENLTSFGGAMASPGGQTLLTELIKAGAAGSSGTITEPYALQAKFPHPRLYVNYAQGASLVEAFYLNVTCPYQLLIVGDPLCQPFSNAPQPPLDVELRSLQTSDSIKLKFDRRGPTYLDWLDEPGSRAARRTPLAPVAISVLFDGKDPRAGMIESNVVINLNHLSPGYHELTLRFVADDPLSQRRDFTLPVWLGAEDVIQMEFPELVAKAGLKQPTSQPKDEETAFKTSLRDEFLRVHVAARDAKRVSLWHEFEQLASASGAAGEFSIPLKSLGMGPVRLHVQAEMEDDAIMLGQPSLLEVLP